MNQSKLLILENQSILNATLAIEIINNCLSESKQRFARLIKRGTSRQLHVQS